MHTCMSMGSLSASKVKVNLCKHIDFLEGVYSDLLLTKSMSKYSRMICILLFKIPKAYRLLTSSTITIYFSRC
jgi:hypothetical protein